ncbi:Peptidylprolyl isomerase [Planktothrix tepida]|uniref:peptidylprolyl isomerase n=2 Tax=Planktothrix TaxID=54304 RepID=A0A1J1LKA4_9CYAN|nr:MULTISPECIES: peptidylprolyl isomerase [Planktothrix]CAD5943756.1 Peptidylprolyl isomerase [Planktothrix tepida]CAD5967479.1 Peptidylprolyl isomerase [Planktothrix pseudagardhii]CUR32936.1 PpiC-type peptidyl-prolyl cis-trans isomerase [Planktothrix tepida PCC 9214]
MANPFLTVNDEPIILGQALKYLQTAGKLQPMITDILREYILDRELQARSDLDVPAASIEQAVVNFRLERNLSDPQAFQQWLENNRMSYEGFHQQIMLGFKREKLKLLVVEPELENYFVQRKPALDAVILSRISLNDYELAETLFNRLKEQETRFEELAKEYSITNESSFNGMMGAVSLSTLPDSLKVIVQQTLPGQIISPQEVEGGWCIFRVEQFLEASLENPQIKQRLQNELFERWLNQQLQSAKITLNIQD